MATEANGFATAGLDGEVRFWDLATGEPTDFPTLKHPDWILTVDRSKDGQRLVTSCRDGMATPTFFRPIRFASGMVAATMLEVVESTSATRKVLPL